MTFPYIPKELVNIVLEFYGQIEYRKGEYINIIHKHDIRYTILQAIIDKKKEIAKTDNIFFRANSGGFYFSFELGIPDRRISLCYDYNFSWRDTFEICYYDIKDGLVQIRTIL